MALIPLAIGLAAATGAVRRAVDPSFGSWLLVSIGLIAGSQMHAIFWPSMYGSLVIRAAVAVTIVVGGVLELRRVVAERASLLAEEQERVRRLEELTVLRADFTSMVAHELATPLAAIANLARVASLQSVPDTLRMESASTITSETKLLQALVRDISDAAEVERDDFKADLRPVSVRSMINDAAAYARSVDATHPLVVDEATEAEVLADPERIGQVLRNLLNNAMKHTPSGTRVTLRARRTGHLVLIEVEDTGQGISPMDQRRIFEKFGRGPSANGNRVPGRGLGLYLSRRILRSHGTDLKLLSTSGNGALFSFELESAT
jgi:two-component system sensor histidine kinase SenX3